MVFMRVNNKRNFNIINWKLIKPIHRFRTILTLSYAYHILSNIFDVRCTEVSVFEFSQCLIYYCKSRPVEFITVFQNVSSTNNKGSKHIFQRVLNELLKVMVCTQHPNDANISPLHLVFKPLSFSNIFVIQTNLILKTILAKGIFITLISYS